MPNYITEVVDALAAEIGGPGLEPEFLDAYSLLVLTRGEACTLEDVHEAWGIVRHRTRPDHPDLIPFDQLTPEVQEYDRVYRDAIRAVAAERAVQP